MPARAEYRVAARAVQQFKYRGAQAVTDRCDFFMHSVHLLLRTLATAYRRGSHPDDSDIASLVSALEHDLEGSGRVGALQGLHEVLCDPNGESFVKRVADDLWYAAFEGL